MRTHSNNFKTKISTPGKMISNKITYTVNGETKTLTDNDLFGISLNNETDLFKTVMQELEFQTKKPIATETIINFQSGVKLQSDVNYDYINYGDFIVNSYEWVAEENNFKQIAYDNMLKTMIEYDGLNVTYPITVKNYINAIATKCGLTFANINDEFANYNREIEQEYFTVGEYTYRDILDYLCEIVGGWMIINSSNELEIKYPQEPEYVEDTKTGNPITTEKALANKLLDFKLEGNTEQDSLTGINLLNTYNINAKLSNLTLTSDENGIITLNGTTSAGNVWLKRDLSFPLNGTYTLIFKKISGEMTTTGNVRMRYAIGNSSNNGAAVIAGRLITNVFDKNSSIVVTTATINDTLANLSMYINPDATFTNYKVAIYLVQGTYTSENIPDYQPFVGGIPSPNPDYPQNIDVVTGNCNLKINNKNYKLNFGKQLFDKNNANVLNSYIDSNHTTITSNSNNRTIWIACKPNTTYTISKSASPNTRQIAYTNTIPANGVQTYGMIQISPNKTKGTITTGNDAKYLVVRLFSTAQDTITFEQMLSSLQIEEGSQATSYSPYFTPIEFCGIGDYKDILFKNTTKSEYYSSDLTENAWYKLKKIGKIDLSSISWNTAGHNIQTRYYTNTIPNIKYVSSNTQVGNGLAEKYKIVKGQGISSVSNCLAIDVSIVSVCDNSSPTGLFYYALANPTYEVIENQELIDTLNNIELFEGINNISFSGNLDTDISITYYTNQESNIEHFNKDFLNNMNISFEKKYGPINSLVLSRALDTDNIIKQDQDSINLNGLNELKISDNPFLDNTDRDDYINDIFNKVNGLEYYIMDVSSPGIMYLEPGDLYYFDIANDTIGYKSGTIKSGIAKLQKSVSGNYKCLYLNSRIIFSQGLEENIYNREPIISKTDYTTSSPSDKAVRDAVILTNKNAGEIVLKATSDGKLVQVALKGNANKDGSAFIVDADNISLNGKTINLTSDDITIDSQYFKLYSSGVVEMNDARDQLQQFITMYYSKDTNNEKKATYTPQGITLKDKTLYTNYGYDTDYSYIQMNAGSGLTPRFIVACRGSLTNDNGSIFITHKQIHMDKVDYNNQVLATTDILPTGITTPQVTQTSLETDKKNFEKFKNSIDIIKNIDIYKYHLKYQDNKEKKHIGFVIGDNYNYSKEVTSNDNDSVDLYSFISVCCQAIKEQQEQIETLQQEINILKERIGK